MRPHLDGSRIRSLAIAIWLLIVGVALYLYFFHRGFVQSQLQTALSVSIVLRSLVYLLFGCLRGFTLVPSTYLVLTAVAFFPPVPLLVLTLIGILISSASIYWFSESLHLEEVFERKHKHGVERMKTILQRNELPIIIGWSFFPLAPTDVICYVCGGLEIEFKKFLAGVLIGEGTICAIYIFLGDWVLRFLHFRP
jgi:uncharacterized membrane protein YdjX (TVP38/TMEM64 family)